MNSNQHPILENILSLSRWIRRRNHEYYTLDDPKYTDDEYDIKFQKLLKLEEENPQYKQKNSPTQSVGGKTLNEFKKVEHVSPMYSLDNVFSEKEWLNFYKHTRQFNLATDDFLLEPKLDGLAIALTYMDGKFIRGATRGNGTIGEDVTDNILTIDNIPMELMEDDFELITIYGEVVISKDQFSVINSKEISEGREPFKHVRNLAAGSIRQLDPRVTRSRNLKFVAYDISTNCCHESQEDIMHWLDSEGFETPNPYMYCNGSDEVVHSVQILRSRMYECAYETDGIVIKVNDTYLQDLLGHTSRNHSWAIAWKPVSLSEVTSLNDIEWNVSKTGELTPVGILNPISIQGATISRVNLFNPKNIHEKDIRIGDFVMIQRSGGVIPHLVESLKGMRAKSLPKYEFPGRCPVCQATIEYDGIDSVYACPNYTCKGRTTAEILFYVSRDGVDIKGLGEKTVRQLVENDVLDSIGGLYSLTEEQLINNVTGMGPKKSATILNNIKETIGNRSEHKILAALSIPGVGTETAKTIVKLTGGIEWLSYVVSDTQTLDTILSDLSPVVLESMKDWLKHWKNKGVLMDLVKIGVL